ncbi:RNA-directed DNA polymerase [Methylobacterium bullatum]|uniref:Reverse transcriptase domain-containing protein n=1 Tax=Methylobacterium bullatum TaxID=570505 RepID=A0AAV4ZDN5_9HYPH|nr:RNA-directed DNA polymerase [Methylobacterium bullatum]MBD8903773.1 hypothetical protein [Methylobacterium bullatum]GJD41971.1 hypothetical protein OICFNHDK_4462 [Methylobacterium bullatum]
MKPNKTQRTKALLGLGYFPKELPPPFKTKGIATKSAKIEAKFTVMDALLTNRERDRHPPSSHASKFNMARRGHSRRMLQIVNPINQYYLCRFISVHWNKIFEAINESDYSITKAEIDVHGYRAVPLPPISSLAETRIKAYAPYSHILETDVSSFYHNIYTHSIPWALHGKAVAKIRRKRDDAICFGNEIDYLVRQCQDGQTIGLPVGPDTSRIISEVILASVDKEIRQNTAEKIKSGYRYIDDMFYCFEARSDAESALSIIRAGLRSYELGINPQKTAIKSASEYNEETWPHKVRQYRISGNSKRQTSDVISFFSSVLDIAISNPEESIVIYALKLTTRILIKEEAWPTYEAYLIRIARDYPNSYDLVSKLICTYAAIGYPISESVRIFIENTIKNGFEHEYHYEISWALWLAISLKLKLSNSTSEKLSLIENSVCNVLTLYAHQINLIESDFSTSLWAQEMSTGNMFEENWLLRFECAAAGWLQGNAEVILNNSPYFLVLKDLGIRFFDENETNRPINLPGITWRLLARAKKEGLKILPGRIKPPSTDDMRSKDYAEEVGGDYGDVEIGDLNDEWAENDDDFPDIFHDPED